MTRTTTLADIKTIMRGGKQDGPLTVKASGILNYMFSTRMLQETEDHKGYSITDESMDQLYTMIREPQPGDIVAVVNTGIYLLVEQADNGKTAICARIEMNEDFVYRLPQFNVTGEPNDPGSSFNKFPLDNLFVIRRSSFDMEAVKQLYDKFKHIWALIRTARTTQHIAERRN